MKKRKICHYLETKIPKFVKLLATYNPGLRLDFEAQNVLIVICEQASDEPERSELKGGSPSRPDHVALRILFFSILIAITDSPNNICRVQTHGNVQGERYTKKRPMWH